MKFRHGLLSDCFVLQCFCNPAFECFHANVINALLGYAAQSLDLLSQNRINAHGEHHRVTFFLQHIQDAQQLMVVLRFCVEESVELIFL
ncbi:hypothetical protein [Streptomyces sviceus]|uniref:hypothetical protein n=1 Tax=Streptomyces sviceus TaxID=285530 RepID=UPI0036BD0E32